MPSQVVAGIEAAARRKKQRDSGDDDDYVDADGQREWRLDGRRRRHVIIVKVAATFRHGLLTHAAAGCGDDKGKVRHLPRL